MAKKKGKHVSDIACYKRYQTSGQHAINKVAKLEKIMKEQPNNLAIAEVLAKYVKNGVKYTRNRKPNLPGSRKHRFPTVVMDNKKQESWENKNLHYVSDWVKTLKSIKRTPTIKVKHGKHYTLPQPS